MLQKIIHLLLLLCLITTILLPQSPNDVLAQTAPDPRFGAIESFWAANEAAELNVGWERILFYWNEIQPGGPGDWNTLHVLEEWLTGATANGRTILGLLKNTPTWATDGEPFAGVPRGLYLPIDDPNNLWATYTRQVAVYYGPRGVHHWIIWNEPDIAPEVYGHEFSGTVEDYYQLVKVAYQSIKQADPTATIHLAGLTYWHDPDYLRRLFAVATADPDAPANNYFFDVVSLHIYFRSETIASLVGAAWGAQSEFGLSKPVWINETNASPNLDPQWPVSRPQFQVDLDQQAWYLIQAFALGFSSGASRIAVYKLIDIQLPPGGESFGLLRPDFSKRPAFFAYQTLIHYLSGFSQARQETQPGYFIVTFSRPSGSTRVLWARGTAVATVRLPAAQDAALVVSATGAQYQVVARDGQYTLSLEGAHCDGECIIGGPPIFLVEGELPPAALPTVTPGPILPTATPDPAAILTATATLTATITPTASVTPSPSPTATPTARPTQTATATPFPTVTVTATASAIPTPPPTPPSPAQRPVGLWFIAAGVGLGILLLLYSTRKIPRN
ncbi:MAG: hypothetical protein AB1791_10040 [Chloroflexota bacterium]